MEQVLLVSQVGTAGAENLLESVAFLAEKSSFIEEEYAAEALKEPLEEFA